MRTADRDAFGHEMYDYLMSKTGHEVVERDDGFIDVSGGPAAYFKEFNDWPACEREAMRFVKGRVLDIGCGAGRHSLYLQRRGFKVMGIDKSPLAIEVCKLRGLRGARVMSITQVSSMLGIFDTILMLGNNFGLFGSERRARYLLARFHKMTSEDAKIIAESVDIYKTTLPEHLEYHQTNRKKGRMPGQVRIRVKYRRHVGEWFDYLLVSKTEMRELLDGTGWRVSKFLDSEGHDYAAIITKR